MNLLRLFAILLLLLSFTEISVAAGNPHDRLIIKFEQSSGKHKTLLRDHLQVLSQSVGRNLSKIRSTGDAAQVISVDEELSTEQLEEMLQVINASPLVKYAEIDRWVTPARVPNDPKYTQQWSLSGDYAGGINMPATWDMTTGSADVVVAVIDTGVRSHPDFDSRLLPGYDFISTSSVGNDGNGRDSDASDPGDWSTTSDFCGAASSTWHGTHVAGIIAAETDNSSGIAGINWKSKILPVRTLGRCGGYMSDIADGIRWAAGLSVSGVPANKNPAQVINLSLGAPGGCGNTEQNAINAAFNAGVVVVAAAGNAGGDVANSSPAACANVIAVAAVTRGGSKAYYSNVGEEIDIAAPGGGAGSSILSTYNSGSEAPGADNYESMQGTSMAAPHVAGVVSLMLSVSPGLKPTEIEKALKKTAKPFPSNTGSDCLTTSCGSGILDARAAVAEVIGNSPPIITLAEQQRVNPGQQVTLSATAKDPEGKAMTYQWSQVSGTSVTLANATASSASFVAPVTNKVLVFQLTVTDADNLRAQTSTSIVINQAPFAEAGNNVAAAAGKKFFLNGSASKDDLSIASYRWEQTLGAKVVLSNSSSMSPSFIAPIEKQNMQFVLTVSDGE
ncbi:MAG: S8 family peptidase, partial [Gammaproteobacteria bacterium]|nr:S8 family peptidase [Gammaproteobacteria bacterium]